MSNHLTKKKKTNPIAIKIKIKHTQRSTNWGTQSMSYVYVKRPNVGFCKWTWPGLLLVIDRNIQTRRKEQKHHFLSASKASITTTNNNNNNNNKKQTNQKHTATYLQKESSNTQTQKLGLRAQKSKVPTSSAA
jgi:hypothetical protein